MALDQVPYKYHHKTPTVHCHSIPITMFQLQLSSSLLLCALPFVFTVKSVLSTLSFFFFMVKSVLSTLFSPRTPRKPVLKSYPLIGSFFEIRSNRKRVIQWTSDLVTTSPDLTVVVHRPFNTSRILTGNPSNVRHMLNDNFNVYQKGEFNRRGSTDFLGDGIFNADGETWKFQRQVSSHEFNTRSLRHFVEDVVEYELNHRLLPIFAAAAANKTILDLQDILQRFAFDNICKIAFGYDPACLTPSLPQAKFAVAFEDAVRVTSERFGSIHPLIWKAKKLLNIGSEKRLKIAIREIREFAAKLIEEKKQEMEKSSLQSLDLLSRFLISGNSDEEFVTDIVISFILAGRDTTSAALTWFFWLLSQNTRIENQILGEINHKSESPVYDEIKDMPYTVASLCESMRLYPPVPIDTKEATADDVLPDGTVVKKGMAVSYHPYAMGRAKEIWGSDWPEFLPERWLEREEAAGAGGSWRLRGRDPYAYPVFQAGPRVCLGKEMAFLQMKWVVAGVLRRFRVVPAMGEGVEPVFISNFTAKMEGGFPVKIEVRETGG